MKATEKTLSEPIKTMRTAEGLTQFRNNGKWKRLLDKFDEATMNGGFKVDEGMKWLEALLADEEDGEPL